MVEQNNKAAGKGQQKKSALKKPGTPKMAKHVSLKLGEEEQEAAAQNNTEQEQVQQDSKFKNQKQQKVEINVKVPPLAAADGESAQTGKQEAGAKGPKKMTPEEKKAQREAANAAKAAKKKIAEEKKKAREAAEAEGKDPSN